MVYIYRPRQKMREIVEEYGQLIIAVLVGVVILAMLTTVFTDSFGTSIRTYANTLYGQDVIR